MRRILPKPLFQVHLPIQVCLVEGSNGYPIKLELILHGIYPQPRHKVIFKLAAILRRYGNLLKPVDINCQQTTLGLSHRGRFQSYESKPHPHCLLVLVYFILFSGTMVLSSTVSNLWHSQPINCLIRQDQCLIKGGRKF